MVIFCNKVYIKKTAFTVMRPTTSFTHLGNDNHKFTNIYICLQNFTSIYKTSKLFNLLYLFFKEMFKLESNK